MLTPAISLSPPTLCSRNKKPKQPTAGGALPMEQSCSRCPLKGFFKGDTDIAIDVGVDMDIDSDMAVFVN